MGATHKNCVSTAVILVSRVETEIMAQFISETTENCQQHSSVLQQTYTRWGRPKSKRVCVYFCVVKI